MRIQKTGNTLLHFEGIPIKEVKKAEVLNSSKTCLNQNVDNSFLVDDITGTKIYYGQSAKYYLEQCSKYENNTQIIAPSETKIKVSCDEGEYILNEPGAILINKGVEANVKVIKGSPLVVEYSKKPLWYEDLKPDNKHYQYFAYLARRNHEIYFCDKKEKISSYQNPGEIKEEDFTNCPGWVFSKLYNNRLIVDNPESHTTNWGGFWDNNNFQRDLYEQAGIYGDVRDSILDVWHHTTKSGYDLSGLVKTFDGISIYTHKDKFNQHNNQPTEWMTNSTAWTNSEPFMVGVSRVADFSDTKPRDFSSFRPSEAIHLHQQVNNPNNNLKEIYLPIQGQAILYTLIDGKPHYNEINAGEIAVIPAGVEHGVIAINGEYEHLCTQTPCAFQYGLNFKNILRPFNVAEKYEAIQKMNKADEEARAKQEKNLLFDKTFEGLK